MTVKGPDIYILPLTWKKQQQFTIQNGVRTGISSRHCSAFSGCNERTYCPQSAATVDKSDILTYVPANRTMAFSPQCSLATTHYF